MNINIPRHKLTKRLLAQLMLDASGLYKVIIKLTSNPDIDQKEILQKYGVTIDEDQETKIYSATLVVSTISKLANLDFVECIGMMGRPEIIQGEEVIKEILPAAIEAVSEQ